MKKSSIIRVYRVHGQHSGAQKTAHSPNERRWFIFCHTMGRSCQCGSWLCKMLYFATWAFIKVASLIHSRAAVSSPVHSWGEGRGCGKDLGVAESIWISWFGFTFNSWYSLHLCNGQGLWGKFTNEECGTWSAAVAGRLANVNCSRWCILHPEYKKKPLYMKWNEFYLERKDHHHANCYKPASETLRPFSVYWCRS